MVAINRRQAFAALLREMPLCAAYHAISKIRPQMFDGAAYYPAAAIAKASARYAKGGVA